VLISWTSIHERVKEFFILLLILETALSAFSLARLVPVLFLLEATLIPMALFDRHVRPRTPVYAAVKYFLFTMIGSMFMLAAILWLYAKTGSFDFTIIQNAIRNGSVPGFESASLCSSLASSSRLRSRSPFSLFTPGCRTRTWRRPPPDRCCSPACC